MFNISEFILTNLINGVNRGIFAKEYASTLAVNYMLKGILTSANIEYFDEQTTPAIEETTDTSTNTEEELIENTTPVETLEEETNESQE